MTPVEHTARALERLQIPTALREPLKNHTTFRIGGPAAIFATPNTARQFFEAVATVRNTGLPFLVLGKGSNILFEDGGYPGLILCTEGLDAITVQENEVVAGAGADLTAVCEAACAAGLAGMEFACGIPGSVGGAVYMNAGAFGGEVRDVLKEASVLDDALRICPLDAEGLELNYRHSVLQTRPWVVLSARFALAPGNRNDIRAHMDEILRRRAEKQPLDKPSAGSAFKRPPGAFAGALIEQCGLRGYRVGGAAVSEKHCGFIVNMGGATSGDVLALVDHIVNTVHAKTGITLEKEFRVVGAGPA
ncbi:MAG: UDP-N-acetylmuramate dehydrogenase [Oscillospiraceae bacterium]